jgi:hypothetical protein
VAGSRQARYPTHDPAGEPASLERLASAHSFQLVPVNTEIARQGKKDFEDVRQLVRVV